jgi:hypothetical protein
VQLVEGRAAAEGERFVPGGGILKSSSVLRQQQVRAQAVRAPRPVDLAVLPGDLADCRGEEPGVQ